MSQPMLFTSGNIETDVNPYAGTVLVSFMSDPTEGEVEEFATLTLSEDEAVELATLLLAQVTKVRAHRLG